MKQRGEGEREGRHLIDSNISTPTGEHRVICAVGGGVVFASFIRSGVTGSSEIRRHFICALANTEES